MSLEYEPASKQVGFLVLSPTSVSVQSNQGNVTLTVSRVQGSSTPVSANYITLPDTAVEGQVSCTPTRNANP